MPRIILYAGKGGVGKTSLAAATGIESAARGRRTLVMSLDPAHSLSDAFDLDRTLMDKNEGRPLEVSDGLWIQELDVHEEVTRNWAEVHSFVSTLLNRTGVENVLAEELAILPGMEEVSALLYINRYVQDETYDLIILDCAPTAESLRFVSLPKTLDWYMSKVFRIQRRVAKVIRPVAKRVTDIPLPEDDYFAAIDRLYQRLKGVDRLLTDPRVTSARLVTQAEKMVLKETQRAFMFFSLHELSVDAVIINRVLPEDACGGYFDRWREQQADHLARAKAYFQPVPILEIPFFQDEVLGFDRLKKMGRLLFPGHDPAEVLYLHRSYQFSRDDGRNLIKLHLPFVSREEVGLSKIGDELIVKIGNFKKNVLLPRTFAILEPVRARLEEDHLVIDFGESHGQGQGA